MKKITTKIFLLAGLVIFALSSVNANVNDNIIDNMVKSIWETEQEVNLSNEDKITNLAWSSNNFIVLTVECDILKNDLNDEITRVIWSL